MIEIFDKIEQGTPEWRQVRCGLPTASRFGTVMAEGVSGGDSITRAKYMRELAGEIITGEPMESFENHHMRRGKAWEAQARQFYAFLTDTEPMQVGFIKSGNKGASPDSLIGINGMMEIKTCLPHLIIEMIQKQIFPPKFKAQVQGQIWVAEREWNDLFVYWPKMPPFRVRAYRDSFYIRQIAKAVEQFNEELYDLVEKVRAYGSA